MRRSCSGRQRGNGPAGGRAAKSRTRRIRSWVGAWSQWNAPTTGAGSAPSDRPRPASRAYGSSLIDSRDSAGVRVAFVRQRHGGPGLTRRHSGTNSRTSRSSPHRSHTPPATAPTGRATTTTARRASLVRGLVRSPPAAGAPSTGTRTGLGSTTERVCGHVDPREDSVEVDSQEFASRNCAGRASSPNGRAGIGFCPG